MLYEASQVSDSNLIVIMSNTKKDKIIISNINELLPLAFGPKDLGINVEKFRILAMDILLEIRNYKLEI